ncbi:hypothetical protein SAOR_14185 [Salinisphaera orenii MK-B5]|uniref:PEP-CTERM protein-sorting domain-containing protein n=1 Tax=Salinisphaera orenii MK-B5 TaxID=856730 RepID=A0A423PGK1_9GAMM|nr:hypothetical protein [Salinisphaera orenii]ROO24751.1 hypothetical protein SAOR_14185 [Salinisphaera orenii MK-B5]
MNRFLSTAALTGALLFASAGAQAGMIHFSGAVTGFADLGGNPVATPVSSFAVGDAFSGVLDVADEALAPGAAFGNADIRDYRFSVGDTALTNDRTSIAGTLGPNGLGLDDFLAFTGISALGPACSFCSAEITEDGFTIDHFTAGGRILGDLTATVELSAADVPAPGGVLGFMGLAMIGALALVRRRDIDG